MSKKEKTSSKFLNSAKEYEEHKDDKNSDNKIKVDRTYNVPYVNFLINIVTIL